MVYGQVRNMNAAEKHMSPRQAYQQSTPSISSTESLLETTCSSLLLFIEEPIVAEFISDFVWTAEKDTNCRHHDVSARSLLEVC